MVVELVTLSIPASSALGDIFATISAGGGHSLAIKSDGTFIKSASMTRGDAEIILYRMFMKIW